MTKTTAAPAAGGNTSDSATTARATDATNHTREIGETILIADTKTNLFVDPAGGAGYARSVRSQADNLGDSMSLATGLDTGTESLVRTEFAEEADIEYMLTRFGVNQQLRPVTYGQEVDYSLNLADAIELLNRVEPIKDAVPPELRAKYPNWRILVNAVNTGEYEHDLATLQKLKAAESPPTAGAATPPDPKTDTKPAVTG